MMCPIVEEIIQKSEKEEARADVQEIAKALQTDLGQRLVAYVTGNKSPKVVGRWASGEGTPQSDEAERRLRDLYRTYLILVSSEEPPTIRNWLLGANSHLGDRPPIEILREGNQAPVVRAAQEFISG